ncbi:MAG: molybdopterin-dependent oxidoreductase, partial [Treponema sp.]|nr:molybdopterin-dependent oxidoreductase [Treponema sp.]
MKDPGGFIVDFSVGGMIHALIIRSPIARGTLKEIVFPKFPGSYHLITASDIPGQNKLADFSAPVLADKKLSYIGQPVAILAGPEESGLENLASEITLSTEEEAPIFFDNATYEDIIASREINNGSHDRREGGKIVSGIYITGIQEHWYAEPHGALAVPGNKHTPAKGKKTAETITIYTATQWPYHVRRSVAVVLGWGSESITISPTFMTPHMDGKIWYPSLVSCHAALAAWITKRPVKLMLTREEDFMYSPKRNSTRIKIHTELGENGEIANSQIEASLDFGAFGILEDEIMDQTCLGALGVYRHKAFRLSGIGLRTNISPQGPMAGFGLSQGFFAAERHISRIADSLGQDPAEWRKKNFLVKNDNLAVGTVLKNPVPLVELIDTAAAMSDYYRKWVSYELLRNRRR